MHLKNECTPFTSRWNSTLNSNLTIVYGVSRPCRAFLLAVPITVLISFPFSLLVLRLTKWFWKQSTEQP